MSAEAVLVPDAPARGLALVRGAAGQAVAQHDARAHQDREPGDAEIGLRSLLSGIIGASASLSDVMERIACVAPTKATVLITGESGTGKELVANAVHDASVARTAARHGELRRGAGGPARKRAVRP